MMQMRARTRADLEELIATSGVEASIIETPDADYRYRIIVTNQKMIGLVIGLAADITYTNFKGAVAASDTQAYKGAGLHRIWSIAREWQRDESRPGKQGAGPATA